MIHKWINKRSGRIVELIKSQYINISIYRLLVGTSYMKLPVELRNLKKDTSTSKIKIEDVFFGVTLGILIPGKHFQKEVCKKTGNLLVILIMMGFNFLCEK